MTYHLIEGLKDAEEVLVAGKISLYRLLDYVTARVKAAALQIGRPQNPTMRGRIDGELTWPIFVDGAKYIAAFPKLAPTHVTEDIRSLEIVGFPPALLDA